jgi:hypothetical protein
MFNVIVSLVTLWLAERRRARRERRAEEKRRTEVLSSIGRELQWNRTATRTLDAGNAHYTISRLITVAFGRHGSELATIAPDSVAPVFEHYSAVSTVREGIGVIAGPPGREADEALRLQWIELSERARVEISNSATKALNSLGLPLEPQRGADKVDTPA